MTPCGHISYDVTTLTDVNTRELKANLSRYLREVEGGAELGVTRRGKRIATISPVSGATPRDDAWARLLATGAVKWNGKKFVPPKRGVKVRGKGPTAEEIVAWGRS